MAQLMEHAEYLSKEIGPRPAGTEEEQQAALYITEQFQKDSGFSAQIEEFTCSSNIEGISAIPGLVVIIVAILGMIFPVLAIPAFILAAASAVLYTLEAFGRPIVTRALGRGASQNVVAKYQPSGDGEKTAHGRSRKIVLVARYDSEKVTPGLVSRIESLKLPVPVGFICVIGIIAAAFFLLLHVFANTGVAGIVVNVLTVLALIVCAYPVARAILYRTAPYNEGANNNATGAAALLEVARRISRGSVSEADLAEQGTSGVYIHGEEAALASGLVPEGAQIRYEAERLVPPAELGEYDEEERLLAAKAAIASLTGQPVERRVFGSVADKLVNSRAHEMPAGTDAFGNISSKTSGQIDEGVEGFVTEGAVESAVESAVKGTVESRLADVDSAEASNAARVAAPSFASVPTSAVPAAAAASTASISAPASDSDSTSISASAPASATTSASAAFASRASAAEIAKTDEVTGAAGYKNAPSWFVSAQQNAKKPEGDGGSIKRSRYAQAIEAAEREVAQREAERAEQERLQREAERRAREEAARAAIASATAASSAASSAVSTEAAAAATNAEKASQPVFVPFNEAFGEAAPGVGGVPAADEFAASLGATTAFNPHQLQQEAAAEIVAAPVVEATSEPAVEAAAVRQPRLAGLPSIVQGGLDGQGGVAAPTSAPENTNPSRSGVFRRLRADVPSMSGVIRMQAAGQDVSQLPVQQSAPRSDSAPAHTAAPASAPASAPTPTPAHSLESSAASRQADAHASIPSAASELSESFETMTETVGETDYNTTSSERENRNIQQKFDYSSEEELDDRDVVEMPKSRAGGFFGRFRRKKKHERLEETPQEWLDVDEDFDARSVGRKRGSWESFRDDAYDDYDNYENYDGYDDFDDHAASGDLDEGRNRRWEGGSYSRVRLGRVDTRSGEGSDDVFVDELSNEEEDRQIAEEIEQIYHFRNPLYNTEIWFVALGSEGMSHDGTKAFLAEHADDLRGSMIIEIESLGAGELCVATEEGRIKKVSASSRVKRYMRSATAATGIAPGSVDLTGYESAASMLQAAGFQTMHLLGVEEGKPALKGSADDILENVDDLLFDDNVNFLMELLKK